MHDKQQSLTALRAQFNQWEEVLAGLSEAQITAPALPSTLSVKDGIAHLHTWQRISIARLEAALLDREPDFPWWPAGLEPDVEENLEQINSWIHETNRDLPWSTVHQDWQVGFHRCLELADAIPEKDLLAENKYAWLPGYPLLAVVQGASEHHQEHLDELRDWLSEDDLKPTA